MSSRHTNLILVRHGETVFNKRNRLQGLSNSSLTQAGIEAAQAVGLGLAAVPIEKVYCSDSVRTVQTTHEILKAAHKETLPIIKKSFLREYYFGDFEGVKYQRAFRQLVQRYGVKTSRKVFQDPNFLELTLNGFSHLDETGQAENYDEIKTRLHLGLAELLADPSNIGHNLLLVSHGVLLSTFIHMIDPAQTPRTLLKNASVSLIRYQDATFTIQALNQTDFSQINDLL